MKNHSAFNSITLLSLLKRVSELGATGTRTATRRGSISSDCGRIFPWTRPELEFQRAQRFMNFLVFVSWKFQSVENSIDLRPGRRRCAHSLSVLLSTSFCRDNTKTSAAMCCLLHTNSFDNFCVHSSIFQTFVTLLCWLATPARLFSPSPCFSLNYTNTNKTLILFPNVSWVVSFMMQFILEIQSWHKANAHKAILHAWADFPRGNQPAGKKASSCDVRYFT